MCGNCALHWCRAGAGGHAMRIAIIGNSHIGALHLAIRDGQFKADAAETMLWGVPAHLFNTITYEGGHFRTPYRDFLAKISANRHEALPAHDFDAIVFHGLILNVANYLASLRKTSDDLRCYSSAFLREGLQTCIEEAPTYRLVRALRADYDRRVLMSPMPLMSEDSAQFKGQSIRAEEFEPFKFLHCRNSCRYPRRIRSTTVGHCA